MALPITLAQNDSFEFQLKRIPLSVYLIVSKMNLLYNSCNRNDAQSGTTPIADYHLQSA